LHGRDVRTMHLDATVCSKRRLIGVTKTVVVIMTNAVSAHIGR